MTQEPALWMSLALEYNTEITHEMQHRWPQRIWGIVHHGVFYWWARDEQKKLVFVHDPYTVGEGFALLACVKEITVR